jgi:hypothetical protein
MVSGKPFSEEEIEYVKKHMYYKFPSIIAIKLGATFSNYNGGSRNPKAVSLLMKRIQDHQERATDNMVGVPDEQPEPAKPKLDMRKVSRGRKSKIP